MAGFVVPLARWVVGTALRVASALIGEAAEAVDPTPERDDRFDLSVDPDGPESAYAVRVPAAAEAMRARPTITSTPKAFEETPLEGSLAWRARQARGN